MKNKYKQDYNFRIYSASTAICLLRLVIGTFLAETPLININKI